MSRPEAPAARRKVTKRECNMDRLFARRVGSRERPVQIARWPMVDGELDLICSARARRLARVAMLAGLLSLAALGAVAADAAATVSADGKTELLKLHAEGVQIYECKVDAAGGAKWRFREPLATLLNNGATVGRHFAGPTWELADGGAVVGKVEAQAPGQTEADIALLKLAVVGKRGEGELAKATTIQRLNTRGGAFGGPCDKPGALHLEPYAADYVFLGD